MASSHTKATSIQLSAYSQVASTEKENTRGWVDYGDKNAFPQYLNDLVDESPVHGSLIRSIAQMIAGIDVTSSDPATEAMLRQLGLKDISYPTASDLKKHGGFYWEVIWTLDRTRPARINHLPAECCRIAINRETGDPIGIYFSKNWSDTRKKRNTPTFIPKLDKTSGEGRQVFYVYRNASLANYYGKPDYIASLNYIELSRQMSLYHVNNIQNGLFPSFIVNMNNGVPETQEEMDNAKREIEKNISGASNAGKFILLFNENKERAAEFLPFPITDADKQYQYLEESCTRQIMIAHRVTSPLLFGIRDGGGLGSNTDEMTTAMDIFTKQVIAPDQRLIIDAMEEVLQYADVTGQVVIVNNDEERVSADAQVQEGKPTPQGGADMNIDPEAQAQAETSYNGAQISSALDIVAKVKEGLLTEEQAVIFLIQFLRLPEDVARSFFVGGGEQAVQKLSKYLGSRKKKVAPEFTAADETFWINNLKDKGEIINPDEWELIHETEAGTAEEERQEWMGYRNVNMSFSDYANGDEISDWGDSGLYKLRFAYSQNISENSREFCKTMVADSKAGKVFRFEDIEKMSEDEINKEFAPQGQSTYDIFTWKGGAYCHHVWKRQIYFRKREKGKFMPNDGLKNDIRVGNVPFVPRKGKEGVAPIDTPNRGSLKNS